jgi:hypothetical protein
MIHAYASICWSIDSSNHNFEVEPFSLESLPWFCNLPKLIDDTATVGPWSCVFMKDG